MTDIPDPNVDPGLLANPLLYIISFVILFVIVLILLTWVLHVFYQSYGCSYYPNFWCSDTWTCATSCEGTNDPSINSCYSNVGTTGLASCLIGPTSMLATVCVSDNPGTGGTTCDCPDPMVAGSAQNCMNSCVQNLSEAVGGSIPCCCTDRNNPACSIDDDGNPMGECAAPPDSEPL